MNDEERAVLKRALNRAHLMVRDYYVFMRTHGVAEHDEQAEEVAAYLMDTFDDDAELVLSAYLMAQSEDA